MPIHDPQEDKLAKLAAIAQIYGSLSGPQFHQQELARQNDRDQQAQMMSMLQLMGMHQYQQQELAQRQAALTQTGQQHQDEVADHQANRALTQRDFDLRQSDHRDAVALHNKDRQAAEDDRVSDTILRMGDPKMVGYLNQAQLARDPALPISRQIAGFQHQGQVADAQSAWEQFAPAFNVLKPEDRASQFAAMQQKYGPAMNEVDYSKGFSALPLAQSNPSVLPNLNDPNAFANHPLAPLINAFRGALGSTEMLPAPAPKTPEQLGAEWLKNNPGQGGYTNYMTF